MVITVTNNHRAAIARTRGKDARNGRNDCNARLTLELPVEHPYGDR